MKNNTIQENLFSSNDIITMEDFSKSKMKVTKKKPILHEKKYGKNVIEKTMNKLDIVWIHLKNKCLNRFNYECPYCGKKSLVTCHASINREITGFPDYLIIAGGIELKHRKYGVKTAKFRKGKQKDICENLQSKIPIICINEENEKEFLNYIQKIKSKIS